MGRRACSGFDRRRAVVNRGEVWWAEHPDAGRRPYLVLTRQAAIPVLNRVLAVPATRTVRGIPTEVADRLIVLGFFDEVVTRTPVAGLHPLLRWAVAAKLAGTATAAATGVAS